ncbi:MAG: DUF6690 family protein [Planctomycetota bacterium]
MNRLWNWIIISLIFASPFLLRLVNPQSAWHEVRSWVGMASDDSGDAATSSDSSWPTASSIWSSWFGDKSADKLPDNSAGKSAADSTAASVYPPIPDSPDAPRLEGPAVSDFREILRFDMTTAEITRRWARVTSIPSDGQLEGLRVTLVTGIKSDDLAGSLTYYFDTKQRLQRINFSGTTGDATRLVDLAKGEFELRAEPSNAATLYVARRLRRPYSLLGIEHAAVMRADHPNQRLNLTLELNNPRGGGGLSGEAQTWLAAHPASDRR